MTVSNPSPRVRSVSAYHDRLAPGGHGRRSGEVIPEDDGALLAEEPRIEFAGGGGRLLEELRRFGFREDDHGAIAFGAMESGAGIEFFEVERKSA